MVVVVEMLAYVKTSNSPPQGERLAKAPIEHQRTPSNPSGFEAMMVQSEMIERHSSRPPSAINFHQTFTAVAIEEKVSLHGSMVLFHL